MLGKCVGGGGFADLCPVLLASLGRTEAGLSVVGGRDVVVPADQTLALIGSSSPSVTPTTDLGLSVEKAWLWDGQPVRSVLTSRVLRLTPQVSTILAFLSFLGFDRQSRNIHQRLLSR